MYFRTCPRCGANLDPGERCDCTAMTGKEKAPAGAPTPTSIINNNTSVLYQGRSKNATNKNQSA